MKRIITYILFVLPVYINAQSLSIQELWNKLSETNTNKQNDLSVKIANEDRNIEQLSRYPIVYADANIQRNLIIPTTPVPAIAFDPMAQDGAILPLQFATKWNAKAGVQAEWKFFDPNRKTSLKEKNILSEKSIIQQKLSKQELKKEATLAYISIILASLQHKSAQDDWKLYEQTLQITRDRYKAGRESSESYLTAQQELERKLILVYDTYSVLIKANLELNKYIDINIDNIQQLTSSIDEIQTLLSSHTTINYDAKLDSIEIQLNNNNREAFKRQLLPTLTLNAYYGTQYFDNKFKPFNNNWFGNSYANIGVRVPISNYISQSPYLNKLSLEKKLNEIKLDESLKIEKINSQKKSKNILLTQEKVNAWKRILELSLLNKERRLLEFNEGKILVSEYNNSLSTHSNNQKELWQAQFDLLSIYLE